MAVFFVTDGELARAQTLAHTKCESSLITGDITYSPVPVYEGDQVALNFSYTQITADDMTNVSTLWECATNCGLISDIANVTSASGATFTANSAGSVEIHLTINYLCNQVDQMSDTFLETITINEKCAEQTYYQDIDGDGYGSSSSSTSACEKPKGYSTQNSDCDDANSTINPGSAEICGDTLDNNCDGAKDEGCATEEAVESTEANSASSEPVTEGSTTQAPEEDSKSEESTADVPTEEASSETDSASEEPEEDSSNVDSQPAEVPTTTGSTINTLYGSGCSLVQRGDE